MKRPFGVLALALATVTAIAQPKSGTTKNVTGDQLAALVTAQTGQGDAQVATQIQSLELTERLMPQQSAALYSALPGEKSRQALVILADSAALKDPPASEVVADPQPDAAALRQMLTTVVAYANGALHGLPSFIATRATTAFEDRPQEDDLESTGIVSFSYLPVHFVKRQSARVTYRDGHEVLEASGKQVRKATPENGLQTAGEFGPFLSSVLADAVKGKITWARWQRGAAGTNAVFHYHVPQETSHYLVQFCCVREEITESIPTHIFSEKTAYSGEIAFNPATGAVMRISVEAELTPGELVESAGMVVEYASVQVGEKTAVLPVKSVSLLKAHTTAPPPGMHMAVFKGQAKTFLNDVAFENYHQYRGEMRMVSDDAAATPQ